MNRWPYQSVVRLVFNLDTERKRNHRESAIERERERESTFVTAGEIKQWNHERVPL